MNDTSIAALEATSEELRKVALRITESYMLIEEAIRLLKGENNDDETKTGHEAHAAVQAEREALPSEGDGGMPHEGLSARMGGVREGSRSLSGVHAGADQGAVPRQEIKVAMPRQKALKVPAKDRQLVCEVCGNAFTWGESGFRKTCSEECEKERKRRMAVARANRRRMETASVWETPPPRKPSSLDKKLRVLEAEGTTYAEKQKADTIEKFAKIDLTGRIE